jgi:hypothetical protein
MLVLTANGGNLSATAIDTGIPYHTLRHWAAGDRHPEAIQMAKEKMQPLADRLEEIASLLAEGMDDPVKIRKAPLNQLAVALGILVDKVRLLRGQSSGVATGVVAEVLDPNTPMERLVELAGRMGLRTPSEFGAGSRPEQTRALMEEGAGRPIAKKATPDRLAPGSVSGRPATILTLGGLPPSLYIPRLSAFRSLQVVVVDGGRTM